MDAYTQMRAKAAAKATEDAEPRADELERAQQKEAERLTAEVAARAAAGDEESAAMASLVGELSQEIEAVFKGVPPA